MGIFIGLNICDESKKNIKYLQEEINLPFPVKSNDLHSTLFASKEDFIYEPEYFSNSIEINDIQIKKIKTQKGIDCLALFFECEQLKLKYEFIKAKYGAIPYYNDLKLHITLSYNCGDLDENNIVLDNYFKNLKIINEYVHPLRFEVDRRSKPRD